MANVRGKEQCPIYLNVAYSKEELYFENMKIFDTSKEYKVRCSNCRHCYKFSEDEEEHVHDYYDCDIYGIMKHVYHCYRFRKR